MYTTEQLIQDCVGQFIENKLYSINRSSLLNDAQYCEVWTSLLQWTEKQIKRNNSFIIPHFGLVQHTNTNTKWKFYIKSSYIEQDGKLGKETKIESITDNELYNSSAIRCNISSLINYSSSLSESQLQVGLKHIFLKLSQQIGRSSNSTQNDSDVDLFETHLKIIINFGWGYLSCYDGIINFIFTTHNSLIINPHIPNGLKTIPKSASLLSISTTSIPENIKISQLKSSQITNQEYTLINKQLEEYKKIYKLPIDDDFDNPLIYVSEYNKIPKESYDKAKYPKLLNEFSRTEGATYCNHTNYEAPSSKIGLFYSPTSSLYRINNDEKKIEYTDYLPFYQSNIQKYHKENRKKLLKYELKYKYKHCNDNDERNNDDISLLDINIAVSCKRYNEYVCNRMSNQCIPPLKDEIIAKILNKLEPDLTLISQESVEEILEENLNIIQKSNLIAIKQSILDYILKNKNERERLNILIPPHYINEWGYGELPYSAPASWGKRLQSSWNNINKSSYFVNTSIIQMLELWQKYKHHRLFFANIDDNINNNNNLPMSLQQFCEIQEEHLENTRNIFVNEWYNDSVNIMKKYVEKNGLESSDEYTLNLFKSISAFMSKNLCEIIYESLKECTEFFKRYVYASTSVSYKNHDSSLKILEIKPVLVNESGISSLWTISMELSRDGIEYEIPLQDIDITVNEMIENMVTCFEDIICVEGKIFGLLENVENLSVFIDDEIRQKTKKKILNITSKFIFELKYLQKLYSDEFSSLFAANKELAQRLADDISYNDKVEKLNKFKVEISQYQSLIDEIKDKSYPKVNMGLFQVKTHKINSLIINHAQDLKNGITNHIAKKLTNQSQKLVSEFENGSKILLKKPENAKELVNLQEYMVKYDSKLTKMQNMSYDIGIQLKFLFDTDHALTHDLLRSVGRVSDWNKKIHQHKKIADQNNTTQREFIETTIIEKSKQIEQKMKKLYQDCEDLNILSEIRDTQKIDEMQEQMKAIDEQKENLIEQQTLLKMKQSEFPLYKLLKDSVAQL